MFLSKANSISEKGKAKTDSNNNPDKSVESAFQKSEEMTFPKSEEEMNADLLRLQKMVESIKIVSFIFLMSLALECIDEARASESVVNYKGVHSFDKIEAETVMAKQYIHVSDEREKENIKDYKGNAIQILQYFLMSRKFLTYL